MNFRDIELEEQRKLIERAKTDAAAFGEIFDTHYKMILNYTVRRTGDVAIAEDITSEVFLKAMNGLHTFQWRGVPISAWLYKIAGNELRMYYRKSRYVSSLDEMRERDGFEPLDEKDLHAELQAAQDAIERDADFRQAQEFIATLPVKYQEVIALRFGEQKKITEIAQILNKSQGTVKSLLSRAMARLRLEMLHHETQPFAKRRIIPGEGQNIIKPQEEA